MDLTDITQRSYSTLEESAKYIPNLAALDPGTRLQVYREAKGNGDVEITIFYREPGAPKYRIDVVIPNAIDIEGEFEPHHFRIEKWGLATQGVQ